MNALRDMDICQGRVVVVTGAGRGIGRCHAIALARSGARVVVNDIGSSVDGSGSSTSPACDVVDEIRGSGGEAIANHADVASWSGAQELVESAIAAFGRLDVVVNNAGILRDRMLVNMSMDEWDSVLRVHLGSTFCVSRHASAHWRQLAKSGRPPVARIINTTSPSGLFGKPGQSNYGAAKAGIAAFTLIAAAELAPYGVTVNAVCPVALTRMTAALADAAAERPDLSPEHISPIVVWLASEESSDVTGRVFEISGRHFGLANGWTRGPSISPDESLDANSLGETIAGLIAQAPAPSPMGGNF